MTNPIDEKISQKVDEYAGLISKSLAQKLVSTSSSKILKNSKNLSFSASLVSSKVQILPNGRHIRTLMLLLLDGSNFPLILFDSNAKKYSHFIFDDNISVFDSYESGGELYLSTNGKIELIERKIISKFESPPLTSGSFYNLLCFVSLSSEKNKYLLSDIDSKTSFSLISQNSILEKASSKNSLVLFEKIKFVSGSFELSPNSRVFIQKPSLSSFKISEVKLIHENSVELFSSDKNFVFPMDQFLFLIGEKIPFDLSSENFLKLKKQTLLNSVIVLDSDGRAKQIRSE